ncbi:MAG: hypothetical protein KGJ59_03360 [Bacteroidota bacterium]|nr:hypothetical protein [Bacteroidota bacterium]
MIRKTWLTACAFMLALMVTDNNTFSQQHVKRAYTLQRISLQTWRDPDGIVRLSWQQPKTGRVQYYLVYRGIIHGTAAFALIDSTTLLHTADAPRNVPFPDLTYFVVAKMKDGKTIVSIPGMVKIPERYVAQRVVE